MKRKWKDTRGETVVEVLASVLICALSVALLAGGIMAGANMDTTTRGLDEAYYQYLSAAETLDAAKSESGAAKNAQVYISGTGAQVVDVELYGGGEMYAYKVKGSS